VLHQVIKELRPIGSFGEILIGVKFTLEYIHDAVAEVLPVDKHADFLDHRCTKKKAGS
jgi:hypothetical protein